MTHIEGNKIIAEFMEWTLFPFANGNMVKQIGFAPKRIEDLRFHSSWD